MPVQLDWEIDDVDAPLPDDGAQRGTRAGGCRRWLRLGLLVVLLAAVGLGYLGYKLRQKKREEEDRLRAVVQLELQALVKEDQELFLNHQDFGSQRWRRYQEGFFEDYHGQSDGATSFAYTGQVLDVHIEGHEAWALIEAARDESAWREMWFYHWSKDEGWRHSSPTADSLGDEQEHTTPHLRFVAPKLDGKLVANLGREMETWYEVLLPLFDLGALDALSMTVEFTYHDPSRPDSLGTQWDHKRSYTLLAPSPHLGRFLAGDVPAPELRQQMAGYLIQALIAQRAGLPPDAMLPVELNALRHELRDWTVTRLARELPDADAWTARQAPLVEALAAREGAGVIPLLAAALDGPETVQQALAAVNLAPPAPTVYFESLLTADARALNGANLNDYNALAYSGAARDWRDHRLDQWNWWRDYYDNIPDVLWPSLQVRSVVFNDASAWVETENVGTQASSVHQMYFFRRVEARDGERWLLTSPDPLYFGQRRETRTENLIFRYFERDAQWFDEVVPRAVQAILEQAASDLRVSMDDLIFNLEIGMQQYPQWSSSYKLSKSSRFVDVALPSPRLTGWTRDDSADIVLSVADVLINPLVFSNSLDQPDVSRVQILSAITRWELGRLFPARAQELAWPPIDASEVQDLTLADVWTDATPATDQPDWALYAARRTLIEYLAETHGPGVVPLLLDNLAQSGDVDQWLRASTGQGVDEIEPAWRSWVWETYGEQ